MRGYHRILNALWESNLEMITGTIEGVIIISRSRVSVLIGKPGKGISDEFIIELEGNSRLKHSALLAEDKIAN